MNKLNKTVSIISKIGELLSDLSILLFSILTLFITFSISEKTIYEKIGNINWTINNVETTLSSIQNVKAAFIIILLSCILSSFVVMKIFKNINLIFKTTEGKTKFSTGKTPFQVENVKMIQEIGILIIVLSLSKTLIGVLLSILTKASCFPLHIDITQIFYGLIVLCLSQFFSYGVKLEQEVEGLL